MAPQRLTAAPGYEILRRFEVGVADDFGRLAQNQAERLADFQSHQFAYQKKVYLSTAMKREAVQDVKFLVTVSMRDVMKNAVAQSVGETMEYIALLARAQGEAIAKNKTRFFNAMEAVGMAANQAAFDRYMEIQATRPAGSARTPYRQGDRYSGGLLAKALLSRNMYVAAVDGISWPNSAFLDTQARQWYRLNFGAGNRAGEGNFRGASGKRVPNIAFDTAYGVAAFSDEINTVAEGVKLSFAQYNASPAFTVPYGFWKGDGGNFFSPDKSAIGRDQFWVGKKYGDGGIASPGQKTRFASQQQRKISRGIAAWGFLDAGLASLAFNAPAVAATLVAEAVFNTQISAAQGDLARLNIDPAILERMTTTFDARLQSYGTQARAQLAGFKGVGR